jgi:hypothetical protein
VRPSSRPDQPHNAAKRSGGLALLMAAVQSASAEGFALATRGGGGVATVLRDMRAASTGELVRGLAGEFRGRHIAGVVALAAAYYGSAQIGYAFDFAGPGEGFVDFVPGRGGLGTRGVRQAAARVAREAGRDGRY